MSPTARSLAEARDLGYEAEVVEKTIRIPGGRTFKRDFLGVIDVLAVSATETLGIQASDGSNHSHRREKALESKKLAVWLAGPARRFEVWTFRKGGARGKRKTWVLRREEIRLSDFVPQQDLTPLKSGPQEAMT